MIHVIEAEGLQKSYTADRQVLGGVDLRVGAGERLALIGSNGAGKSTLLKCLIGHTPFSVGRVTTLGEAFVNAPDKPQLKRIRQRMGFVFQNHGLVKRQSVLTNVVHGKLGLSGGWRAWHQAVAPAEFREEAMEALDQVNLSSKATMRADELSGGQAQRVAIARALIRRPALMIADEPAASLDPIAGRDVMDVFSNLVRNRNLTLVFTTHDMEHAVNFADRVVALKGGRILFDLAAAKVGRCELDSVFNG